MGVDQNYFWINKNLLNKMKSFLANY